MFNFLVNLTIDYFVLRKILGLCSYQLTSLKNILNFQKQWLPQGLINELYSIFYIPQNFYHDIILPLNQVIQSKLYAIALFFFPA